MRRPHWDEDSAQLDENLEKLRRRLVEDANDRAVPHVGMAKEWHSLMMEGLDAEGRPALIGRFRGEPGLEKVAVKIGDVDCIPPQEVAAELKQFEAKLQGIVAELDKKYPAGADIDGQDGMLAVIDLAAWAHAEWVRIHPFANGNGRTARAWADILLARYGLPPAIELRPRPGGYYALACAMAMRGDWKPTADVFLLLITEELVSGTTGSRGRGAPKRRR